MLTLSNESGALFTVSVAAINREALLADTPVPSCPTEAPEVQLQ